jgi:uncharacterized protein
LTIYVDTSVLVAATTNETKTDAVLRWLAARAPDELAISDWVTTEFSAALSIKLHEKQIDSDHRGAALAMFARLCSESLSIIPAQGAHFRTAARFADQYALGLRAGDALHLAIAADHGAALCTLDRRMAAAGSALGVRTTSI